MKAANSVYLPVKIRRRLTQLPLFTEALWWLAWAGILISCLPFKRLTRYLTPPLSGVPITNARVNEQVRWAVTAAARRVPWRAVCFHQGIAAQRMLCRRGIRADLCYGIRTQSPKPGQDVDAHVWVECGDGIVVGGEMAPLYREMIRFSPRTHP